MFKVKALPKGNTEADGPLAAYRGLVAHTDRRINRGALPNPEMKTPNR